MESIMRVDRWDEALHGTMTEESARRRYPTALYQIHRRELAEAARITGEAPARTLIGLAGTWYLEAGGDRTLVRPGDVVEVPPGPFAFVAEGPVSYLAVYPLPSELVLN
jgi:quercetin dioxygenase-like cupin family protein